MKLFPYFMFGLLLADAVSLPAFAGDDDVVVTTEDVAINDRSLEAKLVKLLKEKGTLTSSRQGTDSYMMAVLCEYPNQEGSSGQDNFKPYCLLRKVKIQPSEKWHQ